MIYRSANDWRNARAKRVLFFGMSGLGKTHVSNLLREAGGWFHYSVDYRIGTRYMGEHIVDNFKREAMHTPFLAELLRSDSIYIASNITFHNLAPLSSYLGKPGNPAQGGLSLAEYRHRQDQHRTAEIAALMDTPHFIDRAKDLYGYDNFVCDSGGSICEVVEPENPDDKVLRALSDNLLLVWIRGSTKHRVELVRRFDSAPKPMYYDPGFLTKAWNQYLIENNCSEQEVDPDSFIRWAYVKALDHRQPRYQAMAENWGVSVTAAQVAAVRSGADVVEMIAQALEARA